MSVNSGFKCVDIRKFYKALDGTIKPTRTGIALRLDEWERFKQIVREIKDQHPKIAEIEPCWTGSDYFNQEGALMCSECNPFDYWA